MPAAVARTGPREVALPKALKDGFLGNPTGAERRTVEPVKAGGATCGLGGREAETGRPSRAAALTGGLEVDGIGADGKPGARGVDVEAMR